MDEVEFRAACADHNEVVGGNTPHTTFLNEALPTIVYTSHHHPIAEVEDEFGFPFKFLMDHSSELQESLFGYINSNECKRYRSPVEDTT